MSFAGNRALQDAIETLSAWAADPAEGLPEELFLFLTRLTPMINVDLLIQEGDGQTLLTWRDDRHYGSGWHVPGGIVRLRETAAHRVRETVKAELDAGVEFDPEPLAIFENIDFTRRERSHFLSLVYRCRLVGAPAPAKRYEQGPPIAGQWAWHRRCPADLIPAQENYRRFFPAD